VTAAESSAPQETETVADTVEQLIAQRSPIWVLQGPLRHPITALAAMDAALFLKVNTLALGRVLDRTLTWLSRLMHYGEGWIVVALIAIAIDRPSGIRTLAEAIPVLWLTMLTVNFPVKSLFRRPRPFIAFVDARVVGPKPRDFSFPSGHSAAAFAGALLFSTHFPAAAPFFYALAAVVGSRGSTWECTTPATWRWARSPVRCSRRVSNAAARLDPGVAALAGTSIERARTSRDHDLECSMPVTPYQRYRLLRRPQVVALVGVDVGRTSRCDGSRVRDEDVSGGIGRDSVGKAELPIAAAE
jgi:undecaprenyl-diphosphatase